jgi:hypothetical protein
VDSPGSWDVTTDLEATGADQSGQDLGEDPGAWDPGDDPGDFDYGGTDPGCQKDCTNKQCGSDGCGGSCGKCAVNSSCVINQQCQCLPTCGQSSCGDDGCGGTCGVCAADRPCTDETIRKCSSIGPVTRTTNIDCTDEAQALGANNGDTLNNNSDVLDIYPAECGSMNTPGPERVFKFVADQSGTVTFTLAGHPAYLDIYLLGAASGTASCTQYSHDSIQFQAAQGATYWIVVDASQNNSQLGPTLAIDCSWYPPPASDP